MAATPVSTTANLLFPIEPEAGVQACQSNDLDPLTGDKLRNFKFEEKSVVIENIRGKEDSVSLETAGFQFYKHASKHTSFDNDEEIRNEYYPESIGIIKKLTGASRVEIYKHNVRRRHPGEPDLLIPGHRQPVPRVHVDQTTASAIARVHKYLPAPVVPKLLEGRFQIINLWRPIANPAIDWPLALCDYRSLDLKRDAFTVARDSAGIIGETLGVKYNENQKWKYLHGMTPEEVVLFKCAETIQDGSVATCTPHAGFSDPTTPEGTPFRQSIEVRALVFFD